MIIELSERSKQIFRQIVDTYVETGEPSSRTIARRGPAPVAGQHSQRDGRSRGRRLLFAPHLGRRVPTDLGFRLYVDGLLESGHINEEDRARDSLAAGTGRSLEIDPRRCERRPLGIVALRRPGALTQGRTSVQAGRVRPAEPGPRVGRHGRRQWHGREPLHRRSGRISVRLSEAGNYLTARLAGRSRRGAQADRTRDRGTQERGRQSDPQGGRSRPRAGATTTPPRKAC